MPGKNAQLDCSIALLCRALARTSVAQRSARILQARQTAGLPTSATTFAIEDTNKVTPRSCKAAATTGRQPAALSILDLSNHESPAVCHVLDRPMLWRAFHPRARIGIGMVR